MTKPVSVSQETQASSGADSGHRVREENVVLERTVDALRKDVDRLVQSLDNAEQEKEFLERAYETVAADRASMKDRLKNLEEVHELHIKTIQEQHKLARKQLEDDLLIKQREYDLECRRLKYRIAVLEKADTGARDSLDHRHQLSQVSGRSRVGEYTSATRTTAFSSEPASSSRPRKSTDRTGEAELSNFKSSTVTRSDSQVSTNSALTRSVCEVYASETAPASRQGPEDVSEVYAPKPTTASRQDPDVSAERRRFTRAKRPIPSQESVDATSPLKKSRSTLSNTVVHATSGQHDEFEQASWKGADSQDFDKIIPDINMGAKSGRTTPTPPSVEEVYSSRRAAKTEPVVNLVSQEGKSSSRQPSVESVGTTQSGPTKLPSVQTIGDTQFGDPRTGVAQTIGDTQLGVSPFRESRRMPSLHNPAYIDRLKRAPTMGDEDFHSTGHDLVGESPIKTTHQDVEVYTVDERQYRGRRNLLNPTSPTYRSVSSRTSTPTKGGMSQSPNQRKPLLTSTTPPTQGTPPSRPWHPGTPGQSSGKAKDQAPGTDSSNGPCTLGWGDDKVTGVQPRQSLPSTGDSDNKSGMPDSPSAGLRAFCEVQDESREAQEGRFRNQITNKGFVLVGELNRSRIVREVENNGGYCRSKVSKHTHYLLCGQDNAGVRVNSTVKYKDAKKNHMKIITMEEFDDMLKAISRYEDTQY